MSLAPAIAIAIEILDAMPTGVVSASLLAEQINVPVSYLTSGSCRAALSPHRIRRPTRANGRRYVYGSKTYISYLKRRVR